MPSPAIRLEAALIRPQFAKAIRVFRHLAIVVVWGLQLAGIACYLHTMTIPFLNGGRNDQILAIDLGSRTTKAVVMDRSDKSLSLSLCGAGRSHL